MNATDSSIPRNHLLQRLSSEDYELLRPHLEPVSTNHREILIAGGRPTPFVYFLEQGISSVVLGNDPANGIEIGIVGREGLLGPSVVLGAGQSPHTSFVQVAGQARRIEARLLREAMSASVSLRETLLRYVHTFMVQLASTAYANADLTVEQRLSRWLLMCHDRVDGDDVPITHEIIASMLGVRRPGVTVATHMLEGEHLIRAKRGLITIVDRDGLQKMAGQAYGIAEGEYRRLLPRANGGEGPPEDQG